MMMPSFILSIVFAGGGDKKIASQKLEWKGQSKVGSIDNIKHRPGGGNIKVNWIRPFWLMNNSKIAKEKGRCIFQFIITKREIGSCISCTNKSVNSVQNNSL